MTQCSVKRCNRVFHIQCAASKSSSKKFRTNYYRCSKCAVEMKPAKAPKKRNRTKSKPKVDSASGKGDRDDCQDDSAAAAFLTNSKPSSSDDECSVAKAANRYVDQRPTSKFTSISSDDSRDLSTFVVKDNARETDVFLDACEQLSSSQSDLSTLQKDM